MELLLVRHGRAEDRLQFARSGLDDAERPLTAEGRKRTKIAVRGLRRLLPTLQSVVSSPLLRACQTADYLCSSYDLPRQLRPELAPDGDRQALLDWLAAQPNQTPIALVGHEPDLGRFAGWLLAGATAPPFLLLKKGACCLIEMPAPIAPGSGRLRWLLSAQQLRRIGV